VDRIATRNRQRNSVLPRQHPREAGGHERRQGPRDNQAEDQAEADAPAVFAERERKGQHHEKAAQARHPCRVSKENRREPAFPSQKLRFFAGHLTQAKSGL